MYNAPKPPVSSVVIKQNYGFFCQGINQQNYFSQIFFEIIPDYVTLEEDRIQICTHVNTIKILMNRATCISSETYSFVKKPPVNRNASIQTRASSLEITGFSSSE
jgi:hypothetical protein